MRSIISLVLVLGAILGMTGVASANINTCPASSDIVPASGVGIVSASYNAGSATYTVVGTDSQDPLTGLCVYETSGGLIGGSNGFWTFLGGGNPFEFEGVPILLTTQVVGSANFGPGQDFSGENYALNVLDNRGNVCGGKSSCWVRPDTSIQPVPELSPIILTATGLLGLVFVTRKYKK